MEGSPNPSRLIEVGFYTDAFEDAVHFFRDVLGFPVLSESATSILLNAGTIPLSIMKSDQPSGRFAPGAQLTVEVDRRDGEFSAALYSAKRFGVSTTYDGADGRQYTDLRAPDGGYVLVSQPGKPST